MPNPNLTYIRNHEREIKLYLCTFISWKLKFRTLLCYLFLFSPSHLIRNHDVNRAPRAYIYALEAGFSQVAKNYQVFCQTVGGVFLTFLPKIKDGNSICQTLGDALTKWTICAKMTELHSQLQEWHIYYFCLSSTPQISIDQSTDIF